MADAMRGAFETEVKLVATSAMLKTLRRHADLAGPEGISQLVNTYFDTADGALGAAGATLRIRANPGGREQTLKLAATRGSSVRRNEWSAPATGDTPDPALFPASARTRLIRLLGNCDLQEVAQSRIERTTRRIRFGKSSIEVAFDCGTIEADGRSEEIHELELELERGKLADVLSLATRLPLGPDLSWSLMSKAARCHTLAFATPASAVHARAPRFARLADAAAGFQTVAWECLGQLLGNYPLVIAGAAPEAVHQSRVAIRRLRAACSLFGDLIDDDAAPQLRAELKAVAARLGELRDLDVLTGQVADLAKVAGQDASALVARLELRRADLAGPVQAMLSGAPFQILLFSLAGWIEGGRWRVQFRDIASLPVRTFASRELKRRAGQLRGKDMRLAAMSVAERHKLRIKIKKLRYAVEFFSSLFPQEASGKNRRRFSRELARLQESLGELNDLAAVTTEAGQLFAGIDPIVAAGLEAQLEELLKGNRKKVKSLLKQSQKSLSRLEKAPVWWKSGRVAES